jgi:large subunit ribosomal protein L17
VGGVGELRAPVMPKSAVSGSIRRKEEITMAMYRKLGKKTKLRKALLRTQVTQLLYRGKIVTTEARAKEIQKIVEPMITLAAKEKDNYDTVTVEVKQAQRDKDGKRVKEEKDGKKVTVYETVEKQIKKDQPSRLHARREIAKFVYPVVEVPAKGAGRKKGTKKVDVVAKVFDEYAPKYAGRKGGYTRIIKIGQRKGDAALMVMIELV